MSKPSNGNGKRTLKSRGFTLAELLVVVAAVGTFAAILMPALQAAREDARRQACADNFRKIMLALHGYADVYQWRLPAGSCYYMGFNQNKGTVRCPVNGAMPFLTPFLNKAALYQEFQEWARKADKDPALTNGYGAPWDLAKENRQWFAQKIPELLCPADSNNGEITPETGSSCTNVYYCAGDGMWTFARRPDQEKNERSNIGPRAFWQREVWRNMTDVVDGVSNTVALSEGVVPVTRGASLLAEGGVAAFEPYDGEARPKLCLDNALEADGKTVKNPCKNLWRGRIWSNGRAADAWFTCTLPPNSLSSGRSKRRLGRRFGSVCARYDRRRRPVQAASNGRSESVRRLGRARINQRRRTDVLRRSRLRLKTPIRGKIAKKKNAAEPR